MLNIKYEDNRIFFFDIRHHPGGIQSPELIPKINKALLRVLKDFFHPANFSRSVIKVHIGEKPNNTYMRPQLISSSIDFLRTLGCPAYCYGDTTVAYTGPRSYRENPEHDSSKYLKAARENGFDQIPFVVLDRPKTGLGLLDFELVHHEFLLDDPRIRYKKIFPAGGFIAADLVINHAHLTGHLLAKNALAIKSLAMGLSSYLGKIQLHQNLYPQIEAEKCTLCEECIAHCPEHALSLAANQVKLDDGICIGCAQCAAVCPEQVISMNSNGISTWNKGKNSLDLRMAEYALGMLSFFKGQMIHVGHLYTITGMCDCMDVLQKPNCRDIGMVVGMNPFALDFAGCTLEGLMKSGDEESWDQKALTRIAAKSLRYEVYELIKNTFGIDYIPNIQRIRID